MIRQSAPLPVGMVAYSCVGVSLSLSVAQPSGRDNTHYRHCGNCISSGERTKVDKILWPDETVCVPGAADYYPGTRGGLSRSPRRSHEWPA